MNRDVKIEHEHSRDYTSAIWLGLVLLLAAALRIYHLAEESYWVDEIYTLFEGKQSIQQILISGRLDQPPAYYLPFHFWLQIFGDTEVSARSFSVIAGLGALVLVYLVGRELFGKEVGLLSALLMAVSSHQLFYAQEVKFYTFYELAIALSFYFLILALRSNRILYFILYGIVSLVMIYSHTFGLFILAAQNLAFLLQARKYKNLIRTWIVCQAMIFLFVFPYVLPLVLGGGDVTTGINLQLSQTYAVPSLLDPLRTVYRFIIAARNDRNWGGILVSYAYAAIFLLAGTALYAFRQSKNKWVTAAKSWPGKLQEVPDLHGKLLLLWSWLLCPIMLPFIISLAVISIYDDKYMMGAAPATFLLMALGISSLRKIVPLVVSLGALAIVIIPGLNYYYTQDNHQQWREAAVYVQENSEQNDVIVLAGGNGDGIEQKSFDWYYKGPLQRCALNNNLLDFSAKSEALLICLSGHNRFWVIIRNTIESSVTENTFTYFFLSPTQATIHLISSRQFVDISVYLFELAS